MKFLVVDDSPTMRRIVINSLERIGFDDCIEARDGTEALETFDSSVHFVITDWNEGLLQSPGSDKASIFSKCCVGTR